MVIGRALSAGDAFSLTSATEAAYTSNRVRETFSASQDVTVSSTAAQNLNVTLSRIVAMLRIASTDVSTAEATQIRTTYSAGGKGFNPTTGLATTNTGFQVVNHPSTAVGATISVFSYVFLSTDVQTMTITLEALDDDDNVLYTKVVPGVVLKRNRRTNLYGPLFSATSLTGSFIQVEESWLSESDQYF